MADTAAHLVDRVLPEVPVRQWVLTLPYPLRYRCAWDAKLMTEVLRAFLRSLFADQRRRARLHFAIPRGHNGSITFIQRFGSALNLTPHFHVLVLDGVYPGPSHDLGTFVPLAPPETEDVARVLTGTARRILRVLERRGLDSDEDSLASDDPLLALLTAASIRSRIATGPEAGEHWRRLGDRLEAMDDRRLAYRLKTRWRDGTTHVVMERHELLERLAPLIPPPRAHQVRYHGVLAPCASGRSHVVPSKEGHEAAFVGGSGTQNVSSTSEVESSVLMTMGSRDRELGPAEPAGEPIPRGPDRRLADRLDQTRSASGSTEESVLQRRVAWSVLLQRVFEVDALACPRCGGRMRVLSAITDPIVAARILRCLALPARAPPLATAREEVGPPDSVGELSFEVIPEFDFDQSRAYDDGEPSV
jgi:hypothetical protein